MEFDIESQPEIVQQAYGFGLQAYDLPLSWLLFPLSDSGAVIAFDKRVSLSITARLLVRDIIRDPFLKLLGRYVLMPIAALYMFGLLDDVLAALNRMSVTIGNISISTMALLRGLIAGAFLFWLGGWSTRKTSEFIHAQEQMRPSLRQLMAKVVEFVIFGVAFLLLLNVMGINLSALAILGGAIGVGLGFDLQKIEA